MNDEYKKKISQLEHENQELKEENAKLKIKENDLNEIMSKFPIKLSNNEYLMIVFMESKINEKFYYYSTVCKNSDQFINIESLFYKRYPECEEMLKLFLVNGIKVKRFKTLEENKIKNGDIILGYCEDNF